MNIEQPMLAKITKGEWCNWRFWQEDLFVEFDYVNRNATDGVLLVATGLGKYDANVTKARIKGSSAKEFLRCFEIVKGEI